MLMCIDVGNSNLYAGLIHNNNIILTFRYNTKAKVSSDQLGVFFKNVLRDNNLNPDHIDKIAICSVVPDIDYSLRSACIKYFNIDPKFLTPEVDTGIVIKYKNPKEVGADLIANSVSAYNKFPNKNTIIVDLGTATTINAVNKNKEFLGGVIYPGLDISMQALSEKTAKLKPVEIISEPYIMGSSTKECMQSGIYYSQLGAIKEISNRMAENNFNNEEFVVIGTGGFSTLFENADIFDYILPNLILDGLKDIFYSENKNEQIKLAKI